MARNSQDLPFEIIADIMDRLPLRSLSPKLDDNGAVAGLTKHRENPIPMLGQLVSDPVKLLSLMTATGTILTGSRAAAYFNPAAYDDQADWDFHTEGGWGHNFDVSADMFMQHTREMGVQWGSKSRISYMNGIEGVKGIIITKGVTHTVRLAWNNYRKEKAIQHVLAFHMSVSQNFITGSAAVCLHPRLTLQGMMKQWTCRERPVDDELGFLLWNKRFENVPADDDVADDDSLDDDSSDDDSSDGDSLDGESSDGESSNDHPTNEDPANQDSTTKDLSNEDSADGGLDLSYLDKRYKCIMSKYARRYKEKGFKLLPKPGNPPPNEEICKMRERRPVPRFIGDNDSLVVNFAPYVTIADPVEEYKRDQELEMLHHFCWFQTPREMTTHGYVLLDDYKIFGSPSSDDPRRPFRRDIVRC
ncbi:hypothetical protein MMC30_000120 [Trapelia coarctata]|nr:hypothetical protein [Trapelia coarctata]